jgi:hypothetical protein
MCLGMWQVVWIDEFRSNADQATTRANPEHAKTFSLKNSNRMQCPEASSCNITLSLCDSHCESLLWARCRAIFALGRGGSDNIRLLACYAHAIVFIA